MNKEIRSIQEESELRSVGDSREVEGYGIIFNKRSIDLGGFYEVILPSAIEEVIKNSDVLALMNHDISRGILARSTNGVGTLRLSTDTKGVKYAFNSPRTALGDELIEGIKRKDIKGSSFAFTVKPDGDKWERQSDGSILRTVSKFDKLYDISPCYKEAYHDATVALRSLDEYKKNNIELSEEDTNPSTAKTEEGNLANEAQSIPVYSNAELALRAKNEMYMANNK